jgi:hypothetical protein
VDPDQNPGGAKWTTKIEKGKKFHVLECWMFSFWRAEGFSCSLDVLYAWRPRVLIKTNKFQV